MADNAHVDKIPTPRKPNNPLLVRLATVALAGGTNGVDRRTMKKWLEKAGIEIVKPPPSQRLQFVKRADVLIAGLVDEKRLKEAEEEHARYYDDK